MSWRCDKCNCLNADDKPRCPFCSNPKPVSVLKPENKEVVADASMDILTQRLHVIIEKLTPLQKNKLYRYFEDNVL